MEVTRRCFIKITASSLFLLGRTGDLAAANPAPRTSSPRMKLEDFIKDQNRVKSLKRAVGVMKSRKPSDPRSWFFQSAVHGVTPDAIAEAQKQVPVVFKSDQTRFGNRSPFCPNLKVP